MTLLLYLCGAYLAYVVGREVPPAFTRAGSLLLAAFWPLFVGVLLCENVYLFLTEKP